MPDPIDDHVVEASVGCLTYDGERTVGEMGEEVLAEVNSVVVVMRLAPLFVVPIVEVSEVVPLELIRVAKKLGYGVREEVDNSVVAYHRPVSDGVDTTTKVHVRTVEITVYVTSKVEIVALVKPSNEDHRCEMEVEPVTISVVVVAIMDEKTVENELD